MIPPPAFASFEEAEQARQRLVSEIEDVQNQLGERNRIGPNGERLSDREYWEWRARAQHALKVKLAFLRATKDWMRANRPGRHDDTAVVLLRQLHHLLTTHPVALDTDTRAAVTAVGVFLQQL